MLKLSFVLFSGVLFFLVAVIGGARADYAVQYEGKIEVPVERVFAPSRGFDDNDRVEVVLQGVLPNGCYKLASSVLSPSEDGMTFDIVQYAVRSEQGVCAPGEKLPAPLAFQVPFTKVVEIGQLHSGVYRLRYSNGRGLSEERQMLVEKAPVPTPDSLPYAAISNALVSDVVNTDAIVKVTITGILNSTCTELARNVIVQREKDVVVLLPTLKVIEDVECQPAETPFAKVVELGKFEAGKYLIHVRSMDGSSVNHVIKVNPAR